MLDASQITLDEFKIRNKQIIDESGRRAAGILSDEEYEALFDAPKSAPLSEILDL